jgi:hypothetical protein
MTKEASSNGRFFVPFINIDMFDAIEAFRVKSNENVTER